MTVLPYNTTPHHRVMVHDCDNFVDCVLKPTPYKDVGIFM